MLLYEVVKFIMKFFKFSLDSFNHMCELKSQFTKAIKLKTLCADFFFFYNPMLTNKYKIVSVYINYIFASFLVM